MYEYYGTTPVPASPIDCYFANADLSSTSGWAQSNNGTTITIGYGRIGLENEVVNNTPTDTRYSIKVGNTINGENIERTLYPTRDNDEHTKDTWCFGFNARWSGNYCSYQQTTTKKLVAGTYTLKFDVENANSAYTTTATYNNLFYVKVGNNQAVYDSNTNWMTRNNSGWVHHSIQFTVDGTQDVTISFGYGTGNNHYSALETPVLFVSNLYLETISADRDPRITWEGIGSNSDDYLKSISVVKDWTGHRPSQQPETTYYSWFEHQLRFSVESKNSWWLSKDDADHYGYKGLGLCNTSNSHKNFYIHNLQPGDKFNIEYYRYDRTGDSPTLVSGDVSDLSANGSIYGATTEGLTYYTMGSTGGDVCISIPSKTIIRAVRIIHSNYQKATYSIEQVRDNDNNIGYKYTLTGAGVLEDKRGAVPYITMRFGADNDMTFVKKLGDGNNTEFGAASIVDETNNFDPTSARFQSAYQDLTETEAKDHLAGKEWTVFSTDLSNDGKDIFSTILPNYGSYYYFFPEVDGKLSLRFYCEGKEEHMPFWFKSKDGEVKDEYKAGQNTDGSNYYEINNIAVEKGGVYYLCSNPTIVQHEHPIVRLISYEFIPTFRVDPLYKVVANGTPSVSGAATIKGVTIDKFEGTTGSGSEYIFDNNATVTINGETAPMIKCLGNIKKEGTVVKLRQEGNDIKLDFPNIAYKEVTGVNQGGAIVVNLECPAGEAGFVLTVAYDAANAKWDADGKLRVPSTDNGTQVKKWDFYSGKGEKDELSTGQGWDLGKYGTASETDKDLWTTAPDSWKTKSKLFKEVNKHGGLTADWVDTYVNLTDGKNERFFKSVYDMEGDNADMIHETAGLVFHTHANQLGIMNENDAPTNSFQDRYIGLMKGSKFTIPLLDAGDRIVLKMGTYNNENVTLSMTNAKDVSSDGKTIGSNYIIGGSVPVEGDDKDANGHVVPRGEYHIQAIADGDVDIEVVDGQLLKLYTIEIYRNAKNNNTDIITENELISQTGVLQIMNTSDYTYPDNITVHPRYRGLNEHMNYADAEAKTGNLVKNDIKLQGNSIAELMQYSFSIDLPTAANPKFGVFKARQGVQTFKDNQSNEYVTDYADCLVPVGFRERKVYPYTWDFTDLKKYVSNGIDENGTEKVVTDTDLQIWNDWSLRVKSEEWDGNLFASGGQLYGGTTMFEETRGIGITYNNGNNDMTMTGTSTDETGGLSVADGGTYGFIVPVVDIDQAIYVRATPVGDKHSATYHISDGETTYNYDKYPDNEKAFSGEGTYTATDENGDKIFAVKLSQKRDVRLSFQGYEVKKIAVSTAPKTLNVKGWTSESRARVIDPSLTSYMSGKKFRTYAVTGVDYSTKTVTLTKIEDLMPAAANDGDKNACVIVNGTSDSGIEGSPEGVFGDQFHLFVPDMHDYGTEQDATYLKSLWNGDSKMKAKLNAGYVNAVDDEYTNFAFTCMYYDIDPETGEIKPGQTAKKVGPQAFYRIAGGKTGKASSKGNQGYLPILTSEVGYPVESSTSTGGGNARFTLVIIDDDEATGIATVEQVAEDNGRFFNLSGQQLSGKPNRSGLYIVNGKKVYIKNK